jgi:hypothetical protein
MNQYDIKNEPMVLFPSTLAKFKEYKNFVDVLSLYMFYYYTAKYQQTNTVKCTTKFASKGINISEKRVRAAKTILLELDLIEDVVKRNDYGHVYYYVFVKFSSSSSIPNKKDWDSPKSDVTTLADFHSVENGQTNALSYKKQNSISNNKEKNIKKDSENYLVAMGEFENVLISNENFKKLCNKYKPNNVKYHLEQLSSYLANKNKNYKNHYAVLVQWLNVDKRNNPSKYVVEQMFFGGE